MYKQHKGKGREGTMMSIGRICGLIIGVSLTLSGVTANATPIVSIDMDVDTDGIQDTRSEISPGVLLSPGDVFPVGIIITTDEMGMSSFSTSVRYDTAELGEVGFLETPPSPFVAALPGVTSFDEGEMIRLSSFDGFTTGNGPVSAAFQIGTIDFQVVSLIDDGAPDVIPGDFDMNADFFFDNATPFGNQLFPNFAPGYVIPEPASMLLLGLGGLALMRRRR